MAASTSTAEIKSATIAQLQEHAGEAIKRNHEEAGFGTLNVDWQRLQFLENAGCAIVLAAWVGPVVVGYSLAFVLDQIDTADRYCQGHVVYVLPEYRKGTNLGKRLLRATEGAADAQGCISMVWQCREKSALAKIVQSLGYYEGERLYHKQLAGGDP